MTDEAPPIRHIFDLGKLSQAGANVVVTAHDDELASLARWADVVAVRAFAANVSLTKLSQTRFELEADLEADIVQSCVVTLEPVATHIARHFARELHFAPRAQPEGGELTLSAGDDDAPETIASLDYDLATPVLEEFLLAIDPYPRKEGVAFTPPAEPAQPPQSPFEVLKRLKEHG